MTTKSSKKQYQPEKTVFNPGDHVYYENREQVYKVSNYRDIKGKTYVVVKDSDGDSFSVIPESLSYELKSNQAKKQGDEIHVAKILERIEKLESKKGLKADKSIKDWLLTPRSLQIKLVKIAMWFTMWFILVVIDLILREIPILTVLSPVVLSLCLIYGTCKIWNWRSLSCSGQI